MNIFNDIGKELIAWVYEYDENYTFVTKVGDMTSYVPFSFTASSTTKYIKVVFNYLTSSSGSTSPEYTLNISDVYGGILL